MTFFVRAVVTGFALSLGSALFKKVQHQLGLDEKDQAGKDKSDKSEETAQQDAATDPGLS